MNKNREKEEKSPDDDEALLDELAREERKTLPKELLDDMKDYVDFMTGEGKYADKETK